MDLYFNGEFNLDKPLTVEHCRTLKEFADERHEGEEFPGRYCQWIPNENGTALVWDECEKFRHATFWIIHLIDNFLKPWGYTVNGKVWWERDVNDLGTIKVEDNVVTVYEGGSHWGDVESDEILMILSNFINYLSEEGDDFLENLGDQQFTEEALAMDYDDVHDKIADAVCKFDPQETLDEIKKYVVEPNHIYIQVLRATTYMQGIHPKPVTEGQQ